MRDKTFLSASFFDDVIANWLEFIKQILQKSYRLKLNVRT